MLKNQPHLPENTDTWSNMHCGSSSTAKFTNRRTIRAPGGLIIFQEHLRLGLYPATSLYPGLIMVPVALVNTVVSGQTSDRCSGAGASAITFCS